MKNNYHHGDLIHALAEKGREILEQEGVEKLSLRKIAAETGVSHTAPYRHFKDKTELLAKIAENGYIELYEAMQNCITDSGDSINHIKAIALEYVKLCTRIPETSKLMFSGIIIIKDHPDLKSAATDAYTLLADVIKRGQSDGEIKNGDIDKYTAAVWASIHGLSALIKAENHKDDNHTINVINHTVPAIMDIIINGLAS